jgi:hypothetical protein
MKADGEQWRFEAEDDEIMLPKRLRRKVNEHSLCTRGDHGWMDEQQRMVMKEGANGAELSTFSRGV